jgi:hypothetical protein
MGEGVVVIMKLVVYFILKWNVWVGIHFILYYIINIFLYFVYVLCFCLKKRAKLVCAQGKLYKEWFHRHRRLHATPLNIQ